MLANKRDFCPPPILLYIICEPVCPPPNNLLKNLPTVLLLNALFICCIVVGCPNCVLVSQYEPAIGDTGNILPANLNAKSVAASIGFEGTVIA